MTGYITGSDAFFYIKTTGETGGTHTTYGLSDFSLTISRDTVEQELLGSPGNYYAYGNLSIDGSFTMCKFAASNQADALYSIVNASLCQISGGVANGAADLRWNFASCQITGYDVSWGDASTITEASIDFTVLDPYNVTYSNGLISDK